MKKILLLASLLGNLLTAEDILHTNKDIENKVVSFIESDIPDKNSVISVKAAGSFLIADGWYGVSTVIEKVGGEIRDVFLSNGKYMAQNIVNIENGKDYGLAAKEFLSKKLDNSFYSKENLIYGKADAKNRIVVFSNPLCPHCLNYIEELKKYISHYSSLDVCVYYYPTPLNIFPSGDGLIKEAERAKIVLRDKEADWKLYHALFTDIKLYELASGGKIDVVIKKVFGSFDAEAGQKEAEAVLATNNLKIEALEVKGTPSVYINGVADIGFKKVFKLHEEQGR
ncbi:MAG: thioredoxin domain-containing protein [Sulfurimonas sp.]|uniref:DsbA family protein n=1 Tax=Sulfurimonas sp. TaxID=2022749 RepID=UPI00263308B2|nr:thioredoxin domain-containing protein [Sulfurimonas sp.]MDD5373297.1 thioredoxin domain-containing protein [Sulfurimonas sp.]